MISVLCELTASKSTQLHCFLFCFAVSIHYSTSAFPESVSEMNGSSGAGAILPISIAASFSSATVSLFPFLFLLHISSFILLLSHKTQPAGRPSPARCQGQRRVTVICTCTTGRHRHVTTTAQTTTTLLWWS